MIASGTRRILFVAAGCLLLAGCGPAKSTGAAAGAKPAAASGGTAASTADATPAPVAAGGGGLTACQVITEQDASTAVGHAVGAGTPGGTAALSECIYDQGALIVGMKTDSKAFYDKSRTAADAKGAKDVPGIGDSAFEAGTDKYATLLLLKGTTLVSILFSGTDASAAAVALAKVAADKI
jgi:hypothetical protein